MGQALLIKVLAGFEDLPGLFQFLELTPGDFQFFFSFRHVVPQAVDLVKHDLDRGLFLPRFSWCLAGLL